MRTHLNSVNHDPRICNCSSQAILDLQHVIKMLKKKIKWEDSTTTTYIIQGKHEINIKSQEMTLKIRVKLISGCHFSDFLRSAYQEEFKLAFHRTESQLPLPDSQI